MCKSISIPAAPDARNHFYTGGSWMCRWSPRQGLNPTHRGDVSYVVSCARRLTPEAERRRRRCMAACVMTADHLAMCAMMAVERLLRGGVCALLCRPNVCGMVLPLRSTCRPLRRPAQSISSGCVLSASTAWFGQHLRVGRPGLCQWPAGCRCIRAIPGRQLVGLWGGSGLRPVCAL